MKDSVKKPFEHAIGDLAPLPEAAAPVISSSRATLAASHSNAQPKVHDHKLLRIIGQGAYGDVWLARNVLDEYRAVKVVWRRDFSGDDRPFEREFEGIKRFEPISRSHPSQLAVLHVGKNDEAGYFYYVMELADDASSAKRSDGVMEWGSAGNSQQATPAPSHHSSTPSLQHPDSYAPLTLRRLMRDRGPVPAAECLEIGRSLAGALAHLHAQGLVHRDVKPSNVIFVRGIPKLADIGLVTTTDEARSFVGTEGYVPPEGPGTPSADCYALGKLLYELSTGHDRTAWPEPAANLATRPDRKLLLELNAILHRACASDPRERYQSAEEMHTELSLLSGGQSVRKRRLWQQRSGVLRRIALAAAAVVLAASGGVLILKTVERGRSPSISVNNQDPAAGTGNAKAAQEYKLGLPGLRRGTLEGFHQALTHFTAATEADPKFISAYERLFEVYLMSEDRGFKPIDGKAGKLNDLAATLEKIAPGDARTHAARAIVHFVNEWNWTAAEHQFKAALTSDRGCRLALTYYGYFLTRLGRSAEAEPILKRALELDPDSPLITKFLGHCRFVEHKYEDALNLYQKASSLEPSYPSGHYWAWRACVVLTNYLQALDEWEQYLLKEGCDPLWAREWSQKAAKALNSDGQRGYWLKLIETTDDDNANNLKTAYRYAELYARLGDREKALGCLDRAVNDHGAVESLLVDEFWDGFHREPSFKQALNNVGLARWSK